VFVVDCGCFHLLSSRIRRLEVLGGTSIGGKQYAAFYDELTKVEKEGNYVSVWVKLVPLPINDIVFSKLFRVLGAGTTAVLKRLS
jgi:hypothetical protein